MLIREMNLLKEIDKSKVPRHIAIIMDGNGRWAKQRGRARIFGHQSALKAVREAVEAAAEIGVEFLTLFAFSTENWKRPKFEVNALMELLISSINKEVKTLKKNQIRLLAIGNIESLPSRCIKELESAMDLTADNKRMNLILALSYSARWEILSAVKKIAVDTKKGNITADDIDENLFNNYLTTTGIPDPELMIRTSGEYRISNFLLWQLAYSELHFTEKLWPDFRKEDLYKAIIDYQCRERRFGMTGAQIKA